MLKCVPHTLVSRFSRALHNSKHDHELGEERRGEHVLSEKTGGAEVSEISPGSRKIGGSWINHVHTTFLSFL